MKKMILVTAIAMSVAACGVKYKTVWKTTLGFEPFPQNTVLAITKCGVEAKSKLEETLKNNVELKENYSQFKDPVYLACMKKYNYAPAQQRIN